MPLGKNRLDFEGDLDLDTAFTNFSKMNFSLSDYPIGLLTHTILCVKEAPKRLGKLFWSVLHSLNTQQVIYYMRK